MYRILICAAAGALFIAGPAIAQEKVSLPSTDGDLKGGTPTTITGYLYKPAGAGPFAAVVSIPGCDGVLGESDNLLGKKGEIHPTYGQWGEILSRAGYLVLLVDSFRPRGLTHQCGLSDILPGKEILRDAYGAMTYLRSRPDIKQYSIALMGQSYGGSAVMSAIDNKFRLKLQKNEFRAAVVVYLGCLRIEDAHWRPRIPMLLLMGESDNGGSVTRCKELVANAVPPVEAHFYPNVHHGFDHPNLPITETGLKLPPDGRSLIMGTNQEARADAIERVTQFLSKQL